METSRYGGKEPGDETGGGGGGRHASSDVGGEIRLLQVQIMDRRERVLE